MKHPLCQQMGCQQRRGNSDPCSQVGCYRAQQGLGDAGLQESNMLAMTEPAYQRGQREAYDRVSEWLTERRRVMAEYMATRPDDFADQTIPLMNILLEAIGRWKP